MVLWVMASNWGWNNNNDGVFGGGTVGYNYQTGIGIRPVFGVEADFGGAGLTNNWNDGVLVGQSRFSACQERRQLLC